MGSAPKVYQAFTDVDKNCLARRDKQLPWSESAPSFEMRWNGWITARLCWPRSAGHCRRDHTSNNQRELMPGLTNLGETHVVRLDQSVPLDVLSWLASWYIWGLCSRAFCVLLKTLMQSKSRWSQTHATDTDLCSISTRSPFLLILLLLDTPVSYVRRLEIRDVSRIARGLAGRRYFWNF
jgi:hypothetical protein